MKKIIAVTILSVLNTYVSFCQNPPPSTDVSSSLMNIGMISNFVAGIVGAGCLIFWFWKVKLPDTIEKEVEKRIGEKAGVKAELVRTYFKRLESEEKLRASSILIINKSIGLRDSLKSYLEGKGYAKIKFKTIEQINQGFDTQEFKMILFDNEDTFLDESEVKQIMDKYADAYGSKFVCFTKRNFDIYKDSNYNKRIKIIQDIINLE